MSSLTALKVLVVTLALVGTLIGLSASGTLGAFSSRTENGSSDHYGSGTLVLTSQTAGAPRCTSSSSTVTTDATTCATGSPIPGGTLSTTPASATTTLGDIGNVSAGSGTASLLRCGEEQAGTKASTADALVAYDAVSWGQTGPGTAPGSAVGLTSATDGSLAGVKDVADPKTQTLVAWFKTSTATAGTLLSFSSNMSPSTTPPSSDSDRMIWMRGAKLYAGIEYETTRHRTLRKLTLTGTESGTFDNGSWYMVALSYGTSGAQLWVGKASIRSTSFTLDDAYSGYWHVGYGYYPGFPRWTYAPKTGADYWNGDVSRVAIFPSRLTTAEVATLDTSWTSEVASLAPTSYWPLHDTGDVAYTGDLPGLGLTAPPSPGISELCSQIDMTLQATSGGSVSCVYPAGSAPCPAPSAPSTLGAFGSQHPPPPTTANPVVLTMTLELGATTTGAVGLHMLPDFGFAASAGSWNATVAYPDASVEY